MVAEHLSGYQARDLEIADYHMSQLPGTELWFRGPLPVDLSSQSYFACIGAAQTFGCFCPNPFPQLVSAQVGLPALNLGYGGAGPFFFLKHPQLLDYLNRSRFVIVQVMSGRSENNSRFDSGGLEYLTRRRDGRRFAADAAWNCVLESNYYWMKLPIGQRVARWASRAWGTRQARRLVQENRANWCQHYVELLSAIKVPRILLWFSKRTPDYDEDYANAGSLFGEFPQLVNRAMLEQIRPYCDEYAECVTDRGSPQPLVSRFTGQPCAVDLGKDRADFAGATWTHNTYYPSPEMQLDAANSLTGCLRRHPEWCGAV